MKLYCGTPGSRRRIGTAAVYGCEHIDAEHAAEYRAMYRRLRVAGVDASTARLVLSSMYLVGWAARRDSERLVERAA